MISDDITLTIEMLIFYENILLIAFHERVSPMKATTAALLCRRHNVILDRMCGTFHHAGERDDAIEIKEVNE